jgi:hypothetical protein
MECYILLSGFISATVCLEQNVEIKFHATKRQQLDRLDGPIHSGSNGKEFHPEHSTWKWTVARPARMHSQNNNNK